MEMGVGAVQDGPKEVAAANFPNMRLMMVPNSWKPQRMSDMAGNWKVCTPQNIADGGWKGFSAVGYFFGRELHRKLNVPVGLIDADWSGTCIETWTPPEGFAALTALSYLNTAQQLGDPHTVAHKKMLEGFLGKVATWLTSAQAALTNENLVPSKPAYPSELLPPHDFQNPTALFNGMIHPVQPFGIRGAIWYQGESNNSEGMLYAEKMKALVGGWRQLWGEGNFPFYFVQIAPYIYGNQPDQQLCEFWEAQTAAAKEIPNAGMAVINDIGDLKDIHPKNKQEVGRRLALLALAQTYGQKDVVYSGPTFQSLAIEDNTLRVLFNHADGGLVSRDGQPLNWFEIIDTDGGGFVKANARIDGASVVLSNPEIHHPVAMRFAWNKIAEPNLMNGVGLPARPFHAGNVPKLDSLGKRVPETSAKIDDCNGTFKIRKTNP